MPFVFEHDHDRARQVHLRLRPAEVRFGNPGLLVLAMVHGEFNNMGWYNSNP
jgi:hypothetical protein